MAVDPERWHQLSDVFHKALERPADRRMSFLDDVCRDDPALRDEVVSLLSYHEQSGGLPDTPWQPLSSHSPDESEGSLVGQRLNQYTVIEILGAGGMGVVYLADDTRLGRRVALKALSRRFTDDHERREARAAAGLSHPGIATIYALEEIGHDLYLVSEYVQGATLRDEVNTGPLASGPLLATGLEIARALPPLTRRGVVHRDLKPENVIRTPDGSVKVLDFGLASVGGPSSVTRLTEPGTLLGTPGYISPEQLRGLAADFRSDIFSFGVLLYELAAGVHPFASADPVSTIARVLELDPAHLADVNASCPIRIGTTPVWSSPSYRSAQTGSATVSTGRSPESEDSSDLCMASTSTTW